MNFSDRKGYLWCSSVCILALTIKVHMHQF